MPIPDFQTCMLPILRHLEDGKDHSVASMLNAIAVEFQLSNEELDRRLPSGRDFLFRNRLGWARAHLKKAGLIESTHRGVYRITRDGLKLLRAAPARIDMKTLEGFEAYSAFRSRGSQGLNVEASTNDAAVSPEETMELAHQELRTSLATELLSRVLECSPEFFEDLVVELLVKMGYGGSRSDAGQRIGRSGDGGIDGMIKEDHLGLDTIYLQAKRWRGPVGRPEIQKFVGALQGQRARKGVFITTSGFTQEANDYAANIDTKVVLINGEQLASLMIDFDVGVAPAVTYTLKQINSDYFDES